MEEIAKKEQALLNLGKINGWIEYLPNAHAVRFSTANLSFAFANQRDDFDLENALKGFSGNKNHDRFLETFLSPGMSATDFSDVLKAAHNHLFSQKDGYEFHPGEFKNQEVIGLLREAIEGADEDESIFNAASRLTNAFHELKPFKGGNELLEQLVPNLYLQRRGYIDAPVFAFDKPLQPTEDATAWFLKKTEAIMSIMQNTQRLHDDYHQRISGKSKQRKTLFEDLLPYMMQRPIFTIRQLQEDYERVKKMTYQTLNELMKDLERANIVKESTGQARHRVFRLHEYIEIFKPLI